MEDVHDEMVISNAPGDGNENVNVDSNCTLANLERIRERAKSMPIPIVTVSKVFKEKDQNMEAKTTLNPIVGTPLLPFTLSNSPSTPIGIQKPPKRPLTSKQTSIYKLEERLESSLALDVEKTLRMVHKQRISSFKQQQELETLFYDLTQLIEREHLDVIAKEKAEDKKDVRFYYYYEYISEFFMKHPHRAADLQKLFDGVMMSSNYFPSIYALLFHKWLFDKDYITLSRLNVFLKGTNRLFWSDLENKTVKFKSLFDYLQKSILFHCWWNKPVTKPEIKEEECTISLSRSNSLPDFEEIIVDQEKDPKKTTHRRSGTLISEYNPQIGTEKLVTTIDRKRITHINRDLICLCAKYFFYYRHTSAKWDLLPFVTQLAEQCQINKIPISAIDEDIEGDDESYYIGVWGTLFDADNMWGSEIPSRKDHFTDMEGAISDLFVHENILLLGAIGDDGVMNSILGDFVLFRDLPLSARTVVRLQAALYAFSRPGGPTYPTRAVRHRAQAVMDSLFPRGQYARFLINLSFRLLHQYTWPRSLLYWAKGKAKTVCKDYPRDFGKFIKYHATMEPTSLQFFDDEHIEDEYSLKDSGYLSDSNEQWGSFDDLHVDATPGIQVIKGNVNRNEGEWRNRSSGKFVTPHANDLYPL
jgi:hypothetical protein